MRLNFVFTILLLAGLVVGVAIFFREHTGSVPPSPIAVSAPSQASKPVTEAAQLSPAPAPAPVRTMTPEERESEIETEKDRLSTWQMNNDPESLSNILADLNSPEKEIRMAAIEATKQFGSTNAIPVLKTAEKNTDDSEEQMALLEAADFLSLPPASLDPSGSETPLTPQQQQAVQQSKAEAAIRQQAQAQENTIKQGSQSPSGNQSSSTSH
jgi:hypothetical protein